MKKFWSWVKNEDTGQRTLMLEGVIAEESWFGDEATPAAFKRELAGGRSPITVQIHSPGGDCIAAAQIYNMLMDYPADVTVKIDGLAASAASVIAMAGTKVCMSPTSLLMIHNPFTMASGDSSDMKKAGQLLDEVKESIINAYELKTGMDRSELSRLMDDETWMNANKARELGFCDEILYTEDTAPEAQPTIGTLDYTFSRKLAATALMNKVKASLPPPQPETEPELHTEPRVKATDLMKRLSLLRY